MDKRAFQEGFIKTCINQGIDNNTTLYLYKMAEETWYDKLEKLTGSKEGATALLGGGLGMGLGYLHSGMPGAVMGGLGGGLAGYLGGDWFSKLIAKKKEEAEKPKEWNWETMSEEERKRYPRLQKKYQEYVDESNKRKESLEEEKQKIISSTTYTPFEKLREIKNLESIYSPEQHLSSFSRQVNPYISGVEKIRPEFMESLNKNKEQYGLNFSDADIEEELSKQQHIPFPYPFKEYTGKWKRNKI